MTAYTNAKIYNTGKKTFENGTLYVDKGVICAPGSADETVDCGGAYIIPGLIDVHTHGRCGMRWDEEAKNADMALELARSYAVAGTTSVLGTFGTRMPENYIAAIDGITEAKQAQDKYPDGANILGIHVEGRFLNAKRKGAHNVELLAPLYADEMADYIDRAKNACKDIYFHITCAPEKEDGEKFVKTSVSHGATVGIGHSDATYDECLDALKWGACSFTHLYNAMSPLTHRAPGCVGAAMDTDAYAELICDGHHINPAVIRTTFRIKSQDKLVLITDSSVATGLAPGIYGGCDTRNGKVGLSLDGVTINGSIIDMFTGLKNFMKFTGISIEEAIPYATINPARMVGADKIVGSLEVGKYADFIVLSEDKQSIANVYVRGTKQK